jgi:Na+/H+ antiporter NhaD/arsenite permease-like protein
MLLDGFGLRGEEQQHHAVRIFNEVEWVTIFFFIGLFIVVRGIDKAGVLRILAEQLVLATGGHLAAAASVILWASAVLSATVDNIPFVATMIPLVKDLAPHLGGADAIRPLWWCLSLGACLGGNGTLIGASANLTVAGLADRSGIHFSFLTYTKIAFPMMLVSVAIAQIYVWLRYLS